MKFDPDARWVLRLEIIAISLVGLVFFGFMVSMLYTVYREGKELQKLPAAERAVEKHVMPDGVVCYQPRTGWSRPLSCVRGEGK